MQPITTDFLFRHAPISSPLQSRLLSNARLNGEGAGDVRPPLYEFHLSRKARDAYQFEDTFFAIRGNTVFVDFKAAQTFALKVNAARTEQTAVLPAQLNAMGLFHEILHYIIDRYRRDLNPDAFSKCEAFLQSAFSAEELDQFLAASADLFPSSPVYHGEKSLTDYLADSTEGVLNRHIVLEEIILVWLENRNPAFKSILELISDADLSAATRYTDILAAVDMFFKTQPAFGPDNQPLLEMLLAPALAAPESITDQLSFIRLRWKDLLAGAPFHIELLTGLDFLKEENKFFLSKAQTAAQIAAQAAADRERTPQEVVQFGWFGAPPERETYVLDFKGTVYDEPEQFSPDLNWMPRVVLMAKSTFVWLDQLSKQYQRPITRLDEIPDEEIDTLSRRGFTGLWLIGLWERSTASQRIKHINGNIDAVASAYSLTDYAIAEELGGYDAYVRLRDKCKARGVRLASDMVPNHFGMDSKWVIEHPDWFVQLSYPPFPNYTFDGTDLSQDDRVGIFIEDGYWRKTDAAVVFKRFDRWTGDVRYLYHGNDGTGLPWNDTAQLDFLMAEVREAVIQTILSVAKMFPIIRFDAAMVLAKKHFQRLWYPQPGTGGDIASRTAHGMSREEFDAFFPVEFWREVVDRVALEAPDTLLLAEAFWMMEGYFVRTLGMHRVYNSAFMHMLKKEENANYRYAIKNVLEFNPQILKRYVNFMNNPDEETAVAQFGKDDKYFGVAVMMATMPGLPMFGHGQIEGFTEKYGMEYKRAYHSEQPDEWLMARHEREIFPLLKKRYLFSEVDDFLLYDFYSPQGTVNEDVFAYSNRSGDEKALVVYHNTYAEAHGWIKGSVGFIDGAGNMTSRVLGQGLALSVNADSYVIFRDHASGQEFIRSNRDLWENGLYMELGAFKYYVFFGFREVFPSPLAPYDKLTALLQGRGVPSVEEAMLETAFESIYYPYREAINAGSLRWLASGWREGKVSEEVARSFSEKMTYLAEAVQTFTGANQLPEDLLTDLDAEYRAFLTLAHGEFDEPTAAFLTQHLTHETSDALRKTRVFLTYLLTHRLGDIAARKSGEVVTEWRLTRLLQRSFRDLGASEDAASRDAALVLLLLEAEDLAEDTFASMLNTLFATAEAQAYIGTNTYDGVQWFNKERAEELIGALALQSALLNGNVPRAAAEAGIDAATDSAYRLEKFLALLQSATPAPKSISGSPRSRAKPASSVDTKSASPASASSVAAKPDAPKAATPKAATPKAVSAGTASASTAKSSVKTSIEKFLAVKPPKKTASKDGAKKPVASGGKSGAVKPTVKKAAPSKPESGKTTVEKTGSAAKPVAAKPAATSKTVAASKPAKSKPVKPVKSKPSGGKVSAKVKTGGKATSKTPVKPGAAAKAKPEKRGK